MVDADGVRNVVNEIDQPSDANRCKEHCSHYGRNRHEGIGQGPSCWKRRYAIAKRAEEYAERPLRNSIPDEADQDSWENCVDARVRVIKRIAKTIATTVMIDVAMSVRMAWAT